ncbi:MAG: DUF4924 family protein [Tannerellaceae bacterium]|jgi:flagellin-specific chaperone FliS|nr:DUF4924 family protein [Tannerellaceae bacterium]
MIIAQKKRKENIIEYILYMWYVEDLIRANRFDSDEIGRTLVNAYDCPEDVRPSIAQWYEELMDMMRTEGVKEKGHIQINKIVVMQLDELHLSLVKSPQDTLYHSVYFKTLPLIVQLRAKAGDEPQSEIETCLTAIYGYSILKLKESEVTPLTVEGMKQIATFLAMLSERYKEYKNSNPTS